MKGTNLTEMEVLPGIVGSKGIAVGTAYVLNMGRFKIPKKNLTPEQIELEVARFDQARDTSVDQLRQALAKVSRTDHRIIIESHVMLTNDLVLRDDVIKLVRKELINAEWALVEVFDDMLTPMSEQDDEYLKERIADLEHVQKRLLQNLIGLQSDRLDSLKSPVIIVAHDLSPADLAEVKTDFALGIITDVGGSTSHTSILARAMNIPTLVGVDGATKKIRFGETVVLDAADGRVIVNPPAEMIQEFQRKKDLFEAERIELLQYKDLPPVTRDNHHVDISANIELVEEVSLMLDYGIRSVGLFRTEFLYLTSSRIPTEEEQFLIYKQVLSQIGKDNHVTIRTLDVGADKILPGHSIAKEANPALGARAIRFSLLRPDIFREQIRALLRASVHGQMRIMFPMICGLDEVQKAKEIWFEVQADLDRKGIEYDKSIKIGIMVEVPSAALIADVLAKEVDFFSIGTNDLIQYMLAADRINEHVNYLYTPMHPSVLRVIGEIVNKGHEAGIPVGMCGEMAGEPHFLMLLVGLGLDELSMTVNSALKIKWFLRNLMFSDCQAFAQDLLSLGSSKDVKNHLRQIMSCRFPELFPSDYWERHS